MPAGITYEPITTYTHTGASTTQIDFTGISQSYTDLIVIGNVIYSANGGDYMSYRLNGNSTNNNYYVQRIQYDSTGISSGYYGDNKFVAYAASTSQYVPFLMNINNYTDSSNQTTALLRINNATSAAYYAGLFTPTGAITQVSLFFAAASIAAGTTITIYGVKAA